MAEYYRVATGAPEGRELNCQSDDDEEDPLTPSLSTFFARRDLLVIAFACLIADMSRGMFWPTMWSLVSKLGGGLEEMGFAVALFSAGRIITSPVFGVFSETLGYKTTLIIANCVIIVGCFLYAYASRRESSLLALFFAQLVIGFGSGTLGVTRSYVIGATTRRHRTVYLAYLTAVQYGSFTVMPIVGALVSALGARVSILLPFISEFTLPAFFVAAAAGGCCFLVGCTLVEDWTESTSLRSVKDLARGFGSPTRSANIIRYGAGSEIPKQPASPPKQYQLSLEMASATTGSGDIINTNLVDTNVFLLLAGGCVMNMSTKGTIGVCETLSSEYVVKNYEWQTLHTGAFFAACGSVGVAFLLCFEKLVRLFGDFHLMFYGVLVMALACACLASQEKVHEYLFLTANVLMFSVGYPIGHTAIIGLYSKIIKRGKQGFVLGLFASSGSLARVFFPLLAGVLTDRFNERVVFGVMAVILVASATVLAINRQLILNMTMD